MPSGLVAGSEDHKRGFRRIAYLLVWLVIVPTALLLAVGILMLVFGRRQYELLFGILVVTLVGCLVTGGVLLLVFLRREAKLSKLQLDFVSKVSHELRTPLTSIRMFVEMLQHGAGGDPDEQALCLDVLQRETGRLSERIERLLDWGRMEAGRRVYEQAPDQPEAIACAALEAYHASRVGRPVEVGLELADELPEVLADRAAVVDALVNLLGNAEKYSAEGGRVTLKVSATARHVRFAVRDDGIGIPRGEHRRIFQKFYRVDDRLSRVVEGSGLGLAIVRHVAQGHGGWVDVDSAPGKGSTFTVLLPRPTAQQLDLAKNQQRAAAVT